MAFSQAATTWFLEEFDKKMYQNVMIDRHQAISGLPPICFSLLRVGVFIGWQLVTWCSDIFDLIVDFSLTIWLYILESFGPLWVHVGFHIFIYKAVSGHDSIYRSPLSQLWRMESTTFDSLMLCRSLFPKPELKEIKEKWALKVLLCCAFF